MALFNTSLAPSNMGLGDNLMGRASNQVASGINALNSRLGPAIRQIGTQAQNFANSPHVQKIGEQLGPRIQEGSNFLKNLQSDFQNLQGTPQGNDLLRAMQAGQSPEVIAQGGSIPNALRAPNGEVIKDSTQDQGSSGFFGGIKNFLSDPEFHRALKGATATGIKSLATSGADPYAIGTQIGLNPDVSGGISGAIGNRFNEGSTPRSILHGYANLAHGVAQQTNPIESIISNANMGQLAGQVPRIPQMISNAKQQRQQDIQNQNVANSILGQLSGGNISGNNVQETQTIALEPGPTQNNNGFANRLNEKATQTINIKNNAVRKWLNNGKNFNALNPEEKRAFRIAQNQNQLSSIIRRVS